MADGAGGVADDVLERQRKGSAVAEIRQAPTAASVYYKTAPRGTPLDRLATAPRPEGDQEPQFPALSCFSDWQQ